MILLIGIAAFELCTNLSVRPLVLRYLIAYIPSQLLAFGYVGLSGLKRLKKDKPWEKFDAIMAFAEWGLTRDDIGNLYEQMLVTTYMPEYIIYGGSIDECTVRPGQIDETLTTEKEQKLEE